MSTSRTKAPTYENVIWKNFLNICLDIFHFWGHTRVMRNSHKSMPIGKDTSFLFLHMVSFKQGQNSKHQKPCEGQKIVIKNSKLMFITFFNKSIPLWWCRMVQIGTTLPHHKQIDLLKKVINMKLLFFYNKFFVLNRDKDILSFLS